MQFIKPDQIVSQIGLRSTNVVADFGCGAGYFSLAAAKIVGASGKVYSIDIQDAKLAATASAASGHNLRNIQTLHADLEKTLNLDAGTFDAVMLASILHEAKDLDTVIANAYRLLKTAGLLLIVEWKTQSTPFGPSLERRISEPDLLSKLEKAGFGMLKQLKADSYHYAAVLKKH